LAWVITVLRVYPISAHLGLFGISLGLTLIGFLAGPIDVGVLTLRQRRTHPAWLGRVLTVSMSLNLSGFPARLRDRRLVGQWFAYPRLRVFGNSICRSGVISVLAHSRKP
jgi:hypothetical protein